MVALSQTWKPATQRLPSAQTPRQIPLIRKPSPATPNRTVLCARYYDPSTGEFTSPDPLEYVDGMSLYSSKMNLKNTDPFGLCENCVLGKKIGFGYPVELTWGDERTGSTIDITVIITVIANVTQEPAATLGGVVTTAVAGGDGDIKTIADFLNAKDKIQRRFAAGTCSIWVYMKCKECVKTWANSLSGGYFGGTTWSTTMEGWRKCDLMRTDWGKEENGKPTSVHAGIKNNLLFCEALSAFDLLELKKQCADEVSGRCK
jgi:hypothetical protein